MSIHTTIIYFSQKIPRKLTHTINIKQTYFILAVRCDLYLVINIEHNTEKRQSIYNDVTNNEHISDILWGIIY